MTITSEAMTGAPNPQITTIQHIFPRSCLRHFAGRGGKLQVRVLKTGLIDSRGPNSPYFTTTRSWDQRTEAKMMQRVETDFGRIAAPIRKGHVHSLGPEEHQAVTEMYALWMLRAHRAREPVSDIKLNRVWMAGADLSDASIDELETHGIITVKPGGIVLGRQLAGPQLQLDFDRTCREMTDVRWGVLRADEGAGEFCIPDAPERILYFPLTPIIAFAGGWADGHVNRNAVLSFNTAAAQHAKDFIAARDLSKCPCLSVVDRVAQ